MFYCDYEQIVTKSSDIDCKLYALCILHWLLADQTNIVLPKILARYSSLTLDWYFKNWTHWVDTTQNKRYKWITE